MRVTGDRRGLGNVWGGEGWAVRLGEGGDECE